MNTYLNKFQQFQKNQTKNQNHVIDRKISGVL